MQPSVQARPRWQKQGCGRTPLCAHTQVRPTRERLRVVSSWLGLGPFHVGIRPRFCTKVGFSSYSLMCTSGIRILLCAFCLILFVFHLIPKMCPAKYIFSNTSGTTSIVKAYVSKVCLFILFWTIIGGRIGR
jgi:hypothetical protein